MNRRIYLTFDMDWAIDPILEDFYELIEYNDLKGEINVTHNTEKLRIWGNERLEYGIHPNFNLLFEGK